MIAKDCPEHAKDIVPCRVVSLARINQITKALQIVDNYQREISCSREGEGGGKSKS